MNFVAASLDPSHQTDPLLEVWTGEKFFPSDKELIDRATGKLLGTGGGAASSTLGQEPSSAEIEEVRGLSCGALDPEFDAEEDAAREMFSQSEL